ncbi:MAG: hypothetical protein AAGJ74_08245 [Pseudomonadota bacterium]
MTIGDGDEAPLRSLHAGLASREMTETVARHLAEVPALAGDADIARLLAKRARRTRRTSMPERWFEPVDLRKKIAVAQALFAEELSTANDPRAQISPVEKDPRRIGQFIAYLSEQIAKRPGRSSFRFDRPDRGTRAALTGLGNHAYNKRFRLLNRMSAHLETYRREHRYLSYRLVGKIGLVADIPFDAFAQDPWAAAFTAYFAARRRRRSVFTKAGQDSPFDDLCAALFERCLARAGETNWLLIAHVYPDARVLEQLGETERGQLLGGWLLTMRDAAEDLDRLARTGEIDLETFVVARGNESSSWNLAAQAWNTARTNWIALRRSLGMDAVLDAFLPGKALRLMAADVVWNHALEKAWNKGKSPGDVSAVHPDTRVFAALPRPWDVMRGRAPCNRKMIEAACARYGVDPVRGGWSAPLVPAKAVDYRATPELVHGVEVATPEIAAVLRAAGVFSGKWPLE